MSLKEKLNEDLSNSIKNKDEVRVNTIRSIKAAILEEEKKPNAKEELNDDDIQMIIKKLGKQRVDAIIEYKRANRKDLEDKERTELNILGEYLPAMLSEEDTRKEVKDAIKVINAHSIKDLGKVISYCKNKLGASFNPEATVKFAKELLK